MIAVHNLNFSFGTQLVFEQVEFSVPQNWKIGLVGPNGAGKSTLLNLILKKEIAQSGKIEVVGDAVLVPQEVKHDPVMEKSSTIRQYLDPNHQKQDHEILKILSGLELEKLSLTDSPKSLSGGQKTKMALAKALLAEPDILLLDEPTNFLDITGKQWVMDFLSNYPKTVVLISHDLELMDKQIDKVLFINSHSKKVEEYRGNYSNFVKIKKERDELLRRQVVNEQKRIKRMEESVRKLMRNTSDKGVRQRVIMQRRLEKAKEKLPQLPPEIRKITLQFAPPAWVGEIPIKASHISKSYDGLLILNDVNFYIQRGETIAMLGPNGAGKSTLIKILVGVLEPDGGEIIKDQNLKLGYYSQEHENFDLSKTVVEVIKEITHQTEYQLRPLLKKFLFDGDKIYQTINTLSGGEKTRLAIAMLMLQELNLLILDEPTTYLDVLSQRVILEALKQYQGTMIVVSHTEEFITELKPTRALLLPENIIDFWSEDFVQRVSEI